MIEVSDEAAIAARGATGMTAEATTSVAARYKAMRFFFNSDPPSVLLTRVLYSIPHKEAIGCKKDRVGKPMDRKVAV
ncbi:hypothetical protein GCM10007362_37200 [Saccharibacillus endophyticus]|uniref:Uncharacterized protein n=1 Tax=Saccharibacillus endophyticus TaxID=2060666 RepID=A0ABQ2A314_9BACL|nr:hypothetical protein GCM10007362_37200 [Saccharibacillus endophyticus]